MPTIGTSALVAPFLLRPGSLTPAQERYLDHSGNRSGGYDLGDVRAYLLANPDAPEVTPPVAARQAVTVIDFGSAEAR